MTARANPIARTPSDGPATVIELCGEGDLARLRALAGRLESGDPPARPVVIDLRRARSLDGPVAATLLRAAEAANARHLSLVLCAPSGGFARQVLALLRISSRAPMVETPEAALELLGLR